MSMPTFPEGIDISEEQSLNMLLASIAMEELALSHIMNAEGEKLQYIIGTLPHAPRCCEPPCASVCDVLEANKSVTKLLDMVMQNQMLLKGKLQAVLEAKERYCPPKPQPCPCPADQILLICKQKLLESGESIPFQCISMCGCRIHWSELAPCSICLMPGYTYHISLTMQYHSCESRVCIGVEGLEHGHARLLQPLEGGQCTLTSSFLLPVMPCRSLPITFRLLAPRELMLGHADLCITAQ